MSDAPPIVFRFTWDDLERILRAHMVSSGKLPLDGSVYGTITLVPPVEPPYTGIEYTLLPLPNVTVLDTKRKKRSK